MGAVARLREAGLKLTARGDTLLVEPRGALTDDLRALIRANKSAILEALSAEAVALESRRRQVEQRLRSHPELMRAFDITGAPLAPEPGPPVSVVLAVR